MTKEYINILFIYIQRERERERKSIKSRYLRHSDVLREIKKPSIIEFSTDTPILHITQHTYADKNNYVKIYSTSNAKILKTPNH